MENVSTIKGRDVSEVLNELAAPYPEKAIEYDKSGHPYISYYTLKERIDRLVGISNYDFLAPNSRVVEFGDDKWIMVTGTLIIKDDNRKAVKTVSVDGAERINIVNSGNVQNLANSAEQAWQNAFVKCTKCLNANVAKQLSAIRNGEDSNVQSNQGGASIANNANNAGVSNGSTKPHTDLTGVGKIFPMSQNSTNNSDGGKEKRIFNCTLRTALTHFPAGYKSEVYCEELGGVYPFRIFREGISAIEKIMPMGDFVSQCCVGTKIQFIGFVNTYKGAEQVVMESVVS